jgi:hypothetical protein
MAASALEAAQNLYDYACGNAVKIAEIKAAFDAAVTGGLLTKGGSGDVTSASKNNVSMQKTVGLPETQRISAMQMALAGLQANTRPSNRTFARYYY